MLPTCFLRLTNIRSRTGIERQCCTPAMRGTRSSAESISSVVVINGRVVGAWKRTTGQGKVTVAPHALSPVQRGAEAPGVTGRGTIRQISETDAGARRVPAGGTSGIVISSFYLLTFGVLLIFAFQRVTAWMHARGWIRWRMRRGTSSGLGNAVLGAQMIFQPQIREVLEVRLDERADAGESGDPPEPGVEGWGPELGADDRRERGRCGGSMPARDTARLNRRSSMTCSGSTPNRCATARACRRS